MKKTFLLLFFCSFYCFSQNDLEPGYFILENGDRIEVLIKNEDWRNNPDKFNYRATSNSNLQTQSLEEVVEFAINGKAKYVRAKVNLDQSSNETSNLSKEFAPIYKEETVFLKALVEGEASLYYHEGKSLKNFFYQTGQGEIEPLVYKKYKILSENYGSTAIKENRYFQQQLLTSLRCEDTGLSSVENLSYRERDLIKHFEKYNECKGAVSETFKKEKRRFPFHLSLRPGANYSSLELSSSYDRADFGSKTNLRLGLEGEYVLPFNNNKWALILEPTYQSYSGESTYRDLGVVVDYKSIELPLGLRHYLYLNSNSRFFANVSYVFDFPIADSMFDMTIFSDMPITTINGNLTFGGGYSYKKLAAEVRYFPGRDLLENSEKTRNSTYTTLSFIIGYQLF